MPRYRITFTEKAKAQLRAAILWWRKHRPEAPDLLGTEMRAMVGSLREAPEIGVASPGPGVPGLKWAPLLRSKRKVYYVLDRDSRTVTILAVWGAARGKGPPLK